MKLNHANLAVADVHATADFFTRHFGFTLRDIKGDAFAILKDGRGFVFNLMIPTKGEEVSYSRTFHIGFCVPEEDGVRGGHSELSDAGYELSPVQSNTRIPGGAIGFYCRLPGQFYVEVTTSR